MPRFGIVGPSYTSQSLNADAQMCMNWYVEQIESGAGNAPVVMYPTPGTLTFVNLGRTVSPATNGIVSFDKNDGASGTIGNNTSSVVGNIVSPSQPNEWALAVLNGLISGNTESFTPVAGWSGHPSGAIEQIVSSAINVQGAWNINCYWAECMALLKVIGGFPAPVQAALSGTGGTGTSRTFGSPVTVGNPLMCILIGTTHDNFPGSFSVSDTVNGAWPAAIASSSNFNEGGVTVGPLVQIFLLPATAAGTPTVTFTGPITSGAGYYIVEYPAGHAAVTNNGPTRGCITITGRTFFVCGTDFDEIFSNGTFTTWGQVANDSLPVTMAATPQQLLLASAGTAYVFDLMANTLTPIAGATFSGPVAQAAVCDDFFILTIKNSKTFYVSAPLDATDWVTNGSAIVSVFPDNIVSMIVDHRQVWFFSDTKSVVYYDSGNIFPFDVIPGSFMEAGNAAEFSTQLFPNGVVWLGSDERGAGVVWLGPPGGGTPTRISNHALEFAIQGYARIDDAVAITYQDQGHLFYQIYFPTPSVTWTYDVNTQMWHQRGFFVEAIGDFRAVHYWNHTYNFGKHLVGDWQSGRVYQLHIPTLTGTTWSFATDDGNPIVRVRRAPHISQEQKRQFHSELQVYVETGLGPQPPLVDGAGNPRGPLMDMRWSDNGGHSWNDYQTRDCGQSGDFTTRVRWLRLGRARDRVYEIRVSDPIGWRVVDAYLRFAPGEDIESGVTK